MSGDDKGVTTLVQYLEDKIGVLDKHIMELNKHGTAPRSLSLERGALALDLSRALSEVASALNPTKPQAGEERDDE